MLKLRVALAGNPNAGKSTIFNVLTGENEPVGNWPGTTVARKVGQFTADTVLVQVVDLPGTYSLSAFSPDEQVTRDYIVGERPNVVVNVVDASNLERNLYLTAQLMETAVPLILALNMTDLARQRGYHVDHHKLSQLLGGIPVIPTAASRGDGITALRQAILHWATPHS